MHAEQIIATSLAVDLASESANPWELEKLVDSNPNFEQLLFIYPTNANILVFRLSGKWEIDFHHRIKLIEKKYIWLRLTSFWAIYS